MIDPMYKPLSHYGIKEPAGERHMTKCPLCENEGTLVVLVLKESGYAYFTCTFCGEQGDNMAGWTNSKALAQGYVSFDSKELDEKIIDLYDNGLEKGVSTGWNSLDRYYTVRRGELTVITGIPGHGKSSVLNAMLVNLMDRFKMKVGSFSPEHMPMSLHAADLIEKVLAKPFWKSYGEKRLNIANLMDAKGWLTGKFFWLWPKQKTITAILECATLLIKKRSLDILVIDPWNRLESTRPKHMSETEFIGESLSRISDFAKSNNICVFVVVHPHQMRAAKYEAGEQAKEPKPNAYSLAGSANWNNMADNILSIWRDRTIEGNDLTEIHVLKVRWKMTGEVGLDTLQYDKMTGRFFENGKSELDQAPLAPKKKIFYKPNSEAKDDNGY